MIVIKVLAFVICLVFAGFYLRGGLMAREGKYVEDGRQGFLGKSKSPMTQRDAWIFRFWFIPMGVVFILAAISIASGN